MSFSEWKPFNLGDLVEISSSKRIYAKEYTDYGVPFYRSKEIIEKSAGKDISTEIYISRERFLILKNKFGAPSQGDILLTSVGTLGVPYIVRDEEFYFKDGNLTWMKNFNKTCHNKFIYYWLLSDYGKKQIDSKCIGSTQKALTIETLNKFDLMLPPLPEQKVIAHVLSTLDEKIEVNNQIKKTLKNMTQAMFKHWFVEFEFLDENGNPYKSSGGKMVESELGEIPEGWVIVHLDDYVEIKYGKDHKKLAEGEYPVYGSGGIMRNVDKFLYSGESVLVPRKGTLNNVMYVDESFWSVDTMFYTVMKKKNIAKFIYLFLNEIDLKSMNVGSAVPSMTTNILNNMKIIKPPSRILEEFNSLIAPMFQMIKHNKEENKTLEDIRDALLPKLLSGELDLGGLLHDEQ